MGFSTLTSFGGIPILATVLSIPLITFYAQWKTGYGYKIEDLNGLNTKVHLFIDGIEELNKKSVLTTSMNRVENSSNQIDNRIVQVAEEVKSTQSHEKPSIILDLYLKNLDRYDWHKYCIPEKSNLKVAEASATVVNESIQKKCDWKTINDTPPKSLDIEVIKYLFNIASLFLKIEHVHSMLVLYNTNTRFEDKSNNGNSSSSNGTNEKIKKIGENCNLSGKDSKSILKDLFLSTDYSKKSCFPSPVFSKMKLKVNKKDAIKTTSGEENSNSFTLKKEMLSNGSVSGKLSYSLYDYWVEPKKIQNGGSNKNAFFTFNSWHKYFLKDSGHQFSCSLEKIHNLVSSKEVKLKDFWERCH